MIGPALFAMKKRKRRRDEEDDDGAEMKKRNLRQFQSHAVFQFVHSLMLEGSFFLGKGPVVRVVSIPDLKFPILGRD